MTYRDPPAVNIGNTATTAAAFERACGVNVSVTTKYRFDIKRYDMQTRCSSIMAKFMLGTLESHHPTSVATGSSGIVAT